MAADLLPPNSTSQERAIALTTARVGAVPVPTRTLWNPDTCPLAVLPWLAWALSVDEWDANWTETQKREAIRASIEVHRRKGTIGALKRALEALGYEVTIDENTGEAYTFRLQINITDQPLPDEVYDTAERVALSVKNVRSKLLGVRAMARTVGEFHVLAATYDGVEDEVLPDIVSELEISGDSPFAGGAPAFDFDLVLS